MLPSLPHSAFQYLTMFCSGLPSNNSQSAIELLMTQPALLDSLRKAHMGNYGVVLSLLGCLDSGMRTKKLVDRIIDDCARFSQARQPECD
jgi:hypothetical protein